MRVALPGALLLAAAASSCGGSSAKAALRTYEAAVEDLMAEDEKVSGHLAEIRADLDVANLPSETETRFSRDEAVPFYRRFREKAGSVSAGDPRLAAAHRGLLEYLDLRLVYLQATEAFLEVARSPEVKGWEESQGPWQKARAELAAKAGGGLEDREVVDAIGSGALFLQRRLEPFQRGQTTREELERTLRQEILPRLARLAERTSVNVGSDGLDGAVARWTRAEQAFFERLLTALPRMEALRKNSGTRSEAWERSQELRGTFLSSLKSYRESLR